MRFVPFQTTAHISPTTLNCSLIFVCFQSGSFTKFNSWQLYFTWCSMKNKVICLLPVFLVAWLYNNVWRHGGAVVSTVCLGLNPHSVCSLHVVKMYNNWVSYGSFFGKGALDKKRERKWEGEEHKVTIPGSKQLNLCLLHSKIDKKSLAWQTYVLRSHWGVHE